VSTIHFSYLASGVGGYFVGSSGAPGVMVLQNNLLSQEVKPA
jgi:hypothetical protein